MPDRRSGEERRRSWPIRRNRPQTEASTLHTAETESRTTPLDLFNSLIDVLSSNEARTDLAVAATDVEYSRWFGNRLSQRSDQPLFAAIEDRSTMDLFVNIYEATHHGAFWR